MRITFQEYFIYKQDKIILLDWVVKKDQKLKNSDIERVREFKNTYLKTFDK